MPELDMTVTELLRQWPACAQVLNVHRMACVGCELAAFETLGDAARVYGLNRAALLAELRSVTG